MKFSPMMVAVAAAGIQLCLPASSFADEMVKDYVESASGSVVTNPYGECWRTNYADTTEKLEECGYEKAKPVEVAVEVVAAPTAASVTTKVVREVTIGASMLFGFDSAELTHDATAVIDERIQALRGNATLTSVMRVEGHTDSTGPADYNLGLSQRRAQAVADYILSQAPRLNPSDIEVVGKGEAEPVASNDTKEGREQNRRVVVFAEAEATESGN